MKLTMTASRKSLVSALMKGPVCEWDLKASDGKKTSWRQRWCKSLFPGVLLCITVFLYKLRDINKSMFWSTRNDSFHCSLSTFTCNRNTSCFFLCCDLHVSLLDLICRQRPLWNVSHTPDPPVQNLPLTPMRPWNWTGLFSHCQPIVFSMSPKLSAMAACRHLIPIRASFKDDLPAWVPTELGTELCRLTDWHRVQLTAQKRISCIFT